MRWKRRFVGISCIIAYLFSVWLVGMMHSTMAATVSAEEPAEEPVVQIVQLVEAPKYTDDELFCMAATIYCEAGGNAASDSTRLMVGQVVLNRLADPRFPKTIREVLESPHQYNTFYKTGVMFPAYSESEGEQAAVQRAWNIARIVLERETYICPSNVIWQAEFPQGTGIYSFQDGLYFCISD